MACRWQSGSSDKARAMEGWKIIDSNNEYLFDDLNKELCKEKKETNKAYKTNNSTLCNIFLYMLRTQMLYIA
jgi:hypothetical protein